MNKDIVANVYTWLTIVLITLVHFIYLAGMFGEFDIGKTLTDVASILHLVFTTASSVLMTFIGANKGIEIGLYSEEFKAADKVNAKLNSEIAQKKMELYEYVIVLNKQEREIVEREFLLEHSALTPQDLTKKERKQFKKLKPIKHSVKNITLPLYYEQNKGHTISYDASFDPVAHKRKGAIIKGFTGILTGALTINLMFSFKNAANAFATIIMVVSSLFVVYFMNRMPPIYKLKQDLPNRVANKYSLWEGFLKYSENKKTTNANINSNIDSEIVIEYEMQKNKGE